MKFLKKYKFILLFSILTLVVIGFIFSNSLKSSEESSKQSSGVTDCIIKIFDPNHKWPVDKAHAVIRKLAHMSEFCMLSLCISGIIASIFAINNKIYIFHGLFATLLTAVTDEFIQHFTGRGSSVVDVFIDFSGALIGFIISFIFYLILFKILNKRKNKVASNKLS